MDMPQKLYLMLFCLFILALGATGIGKVTGTLNFPVIKFQRAEEPQTTKQPEPIQTSSSTHPVNATVLKVVDGDTLEVKLDGEEKTFKIRLLGIDSPETVDPRRPVECFGKEASAKMHEMADGKRVMLKADPLADERDKYDRLLRNMYLEDGSDVNAFMVSEGYANAYLSFPLDPKRKAELKKLENDAKIAQRGLWNPQTCPSTK